MKNNPSINTINENPEVGESKPLPAPEPIDPSLKYEAIDGVFHAYPPVLVADPEDMPYVYIRDPKLARLPDGRWICLLFTGGPHEPHPDNEIMVTISEDDGRTWQKPILLFKSRLRRCMPTAYFDAGGRLGIFVMTMVGDSYNLEARTHLSWYDPATDKWSLPAGIRGCPPAKPMRGFVAADGEVIFPAYWAEACDQLRPSVLGEEPPQWSSDWGLAETKREYRHVCGLLTSRDNGETFRVRGYVSHPDFNLWEPTVAEVAPGHLVMLIRAEAAGFLYRAESRDGGETWSPPEPTDILNPSTKPTLLKIGDTILLFHNPNPGVGFFMRKVVEVWVSHDGMKTWARKIPLASAHACNRPICYPDPIYLPESNEIAVVFDTGRKVHLQRIPGEALGVERELKAES